MKQKVLPSTDEFCIEQKLSTMVQFSRSPENSRSATLVFTGLLTIKHIEGIYTNTMDEIQDLDNVEIQIKQVNDLDLSFLQFLVYLETKLNDMGITHKKTIVINELVTDLITNSGFESYLK